MYEKEKMIRYIEDNGLNEKTRIRDKVYQRYYAMKYLREVVGLTFQEIANILGKENHTTIIHGSKQFDIFGRYKDFQFSTEELRILFPITSRKIKLDNSGFESSHLVTALQLLQRQLNKNK